MFLLPRHPAPRGGTSSQGSAEFAESQSSAPRDAPEARPAGLEEAEDKTTQPVKMPFGLQEIKPKCLDQSQPNQGNLGTHSGCLKHGKTGDLTGKTSKFTLLLQRHCILAPDQVLLSMGFHVSSLFKGRSKLCLSFF